MCASPLTSEVAKRRPRLLVCDRDSGNGSAVRGQSGFAGHLPERAAQAGWCQGWGARMLPRPLHRHHVKVRVQCSLRGLPHPRRPRLPHRAVCSPLGTTLSLPVLPSCFPWAWWASPLSLLPTSWPPTSSRHDLPFFQPCWVLISPQTGFLLRPACLAFFSSAPSPSPCFYLLFGSFFIPFSLVSGDKARKGAGCIHTE